jgi:polar amino acid transport system permease protein
VSVSDAPETVTGRPREIEAVPLRHPGRWLSVAVIAVLVAMFIHSLVANPAWQLSTVGDYLFDASILRGVVQTLELTVIAMVVGLVGGILLAVMRLSANPVVSGASWFYIWFFRGTPVLVQLVLWFNIAAIFPNLSFGVPFGPAWPSTPRLENAGGNDHDARFFIQQP